MYFLFLKGWWWMMLLQLCFKWPSWCSDLCRVVHGGCVVLLWSCIVVYIFLSACGSRWSYRGFQFMYNDRAGNAQIFVTLHEVVKTGVAFVLRLVELLLDLSLLWRLKLLLNHWRLFYQKESLFASWGDSGLSGRGIGLIPMALPFNALSMSWFCVLLDC